MPAIDPALRLLKEGKLESVFRFLGLAVKNPLFWLFLSCLLRQRIKLSLFRAY